MDQAVSTQIRHLLATPEPAYLGPEHRPGTLTKAAIGTQLDSLWSKARLPEPQLPLIRALILLWHDHLDAAHSTAQDIPTPDGSFLHAIMHRREPDYWNSKYWFQRTGNHPAFPEIARRVTELLSGINERALLHQLVPHGRWDAAVFVDACEQSSPPTAGILREIQHIEFAVLLDRFLGGL